MAYDVKIAGARIVDGTGAPGFVGDVGVRDGRIVAMGHAPDVARETVNADGLVLAPGFVDIHTHYDVQVLWDPMMTISPWHGVTTVVVGSCGFGVAPTRPADRDLILRTLERVEAMSYDALTAGLGASWPFETFPQYMDAVEASGSGINIGVMLGHTPVRVYAMGAAAVERTATPDEVAVMKELVREGMRAGAMGFATSVSTVHVGYAGKPVPSRFADFATETIELARALGESGQGLFHYNAARQPHFDNYVALADASGRPVCWTPLLSGQLGPGRHREALTRSAELIAQGYRITPQTAVRPIVSEFEFESPVVFDTWKLFAPVRTASDSAARRRIYADPDFRRLFREEVAGRGGNDDFFSGGAAEGETRRRSFTLTEMSFFPPDKSLEGRKLVDVAAERGAHACDLLLDLALASDLKARFRMPLVNYDEAEVTELLLDPNIVIGLGDGGAHMSQLCDACYPTYLLGHFVRDRKIMALERAIWMITGRTAEVYGIADRGRLAVGRPADLALFDPATIAAGPLERVNDMPAGADRLISKPVGMHGVWVNGTRLPPPGEALPMGARLPGRLLRHGRAS